MNPWARHLPLFGMRDSRTLRRPILRMIPFSGRSEVIVTTSYLKIEILGQNQGGPEFHLAGILKYVEDLKEGTYAEFGPKDYFEIACINSQHPRA